MSTSSGGVSDSWEDPGEGPYRPPGQPVGQEKNWVDCIPCGIWESPKSPWSGCSSRSHCWRYFFSSFRYFPRSCRHPKGTTKPRRASWANGNHHHGWTVETPPSLVSPVNNPKEKWLDNWGETHLTKQLWSFTKYTQKYLGHWDQARIACIGP